MLKFNKKLRWPAVITGGMVVIMLVLAAVGSIPNFGETQAAEVSEKDLQSFVEVNKKMFSIQTELEGQMIQAIEDNGLTVDRYMEIAMKEEPSQETETASKDELAKVEKVTQEVESLNENLQKKGLEIIEEMGLTPEKYEVIATNVQNSEENQKRYNEMMEENQG
ncbi:MAG: DUF4168 domain-containing protein [Chitinispirillaceae bacterium]